MSAALSFIVLHVRDLAASQAFYAEHFGLEADSGYPSFVRFAAPGGADFGLQSDPEGAPNAAIELCFSVADPDAQHAAMKAAGVHVISEPKDEPFGRAFTALDPEGNSLVVYSPKAR